MPLEMPKTAMDLQYINHLLLLAIAVIGGLWAIVVTFGTVIWRRLNDDVQAHDASLRRGQLRIQRLTMELINIKAALGLCDDELTDHDLRLSKLHDEYLIIKRDYEHCCGRRKPLPFPIEEQTDEDRLL